MNSNIAKQGQRHHPLYGRWSTMHARCTKEQSSDYHNYGALGIRVDPVWDDFNQFVKDMGMPEPGQVLLRRDTKANFGPDNCYWGKREYVLRNTVRRGDDLTGQTFGELVVISKADPLPTTKGNRWLCRCSCGTEKVVSAKSLKSGDTKSCGCLSKRNLAGDTFGELTVLREDPIKQGKKRKWICQCSCDNTTSVATNDLTSGHTRSCGCVKSVLARERFTTHGLRDHPLYGRWLAMRNRCNNPNDDFYANYGGKGVRVCRRWDHFQNFLEDMGECPEGYTLDREDNDGDYSPENCRWVDAKTQARNKSNTTWVEYQGNKVKLVELSDQFKVPFKLLHQRLYVQGWSLERALKPWIMTRRGTGMLVGVNIKSKRIVIGKKLKGLAQKCELSIKQLSAGTIGYSVIQETWLAKSLEDPTPWNDHKGCKGVSEDVILKQPNEPYVIFSNVREAYRHLERHSLLDKEYTLKVFE